MNAGVLVLPEALRFDRGGEVVGYVDGPLVTYSDADVRLARLWGAAIAPAPGWDDLAERF